jgi:putative ABC transport system permease protein
MVMNAPGSHAEKRVGVWPTMRHLSRFSRSLRSDFTVGLRNVLRQRRRSLVALLAISLGEVAMILAGGFIEWNLWFGRESTIHSQLGHIRVFRPGFLASGAADPSRYLLPDAAPERAAIESTPHVTAVAPRLQFSGLISREEATLSFLGEGVDPSKEGLLSRSLAITQGENLRPNDNNGVILGQGLAANLGVRVGDSVILLAKTASGSPSAVEPIVRGMFSTISKDYDDIALRLPLNLAHKLVHQSGAHTWAIVLDETNQTQITIEKLRQRFGAQGYEFASWWDLSDFYRKVEALYERQFGVVKLIIALMIVLTILNSLTISVMERTGEIGTALALGRRRIDILRLFVIEGTVLGLVGGLAGAVLGVALAGQISRIGIPMPPSPGMAHGFTAGILVPPGLLVQSCMIAVFAAVIASVHPAWRASNLVIVDALRQSR